VVVPHLTESYSSSHHSPEKTSRYAHTQELPERDRAHAAVGARRVRVPVQAGVRARGAIPRGPHFIERTIKPRRSAHQSSRKCQVQYANQIKQLLYNFPPDHSLQLAGQGQNAVPSHWSLTLMMNCI
ncbi:hypothetical protein EVAR_91778_1, partial [Eumeta japonica]